MQTIDRRLVIRTFEVIREGICATKEADTQTPSAAVLLQDEWIAAKPPSRCLHEQLLAADHDRVRGADTGRFEGSVLARLTDLEVESAAAVDNAPVVPFEPSQH